jgi:type III secretory pathway component EscT
MLIDHQRGGASLMVNDPTIQNQSSPLGTIFNLVLIYLFFMIDGPFLFIDAIMTSYDVVPPDQFINPYFFERTSQFWDLLIKLLNTAMKIAVQLASPALIAILMTDVFLGIANRLATQVQITFLGLPLKSLLALTVLFIGWRVFTQQMVVETYSWLSTIENVILMFKPPTP